MDLGILSLIPSRSFQKLQQFRQLLPRKIAAAPVKGQDFFLFYCLDGSFFHVFCFCKGKLFRYVVGKTAFVTGRSSVNNRLMVAEKTGIIQVEIIIPYGIPAAQRIIEGCVQMIILSADSDDIPGMAVFDLFFRVCF